MKLGEKILPLRERKRKSEEKGRKWGNDGCADRGKRKLKWEGGLYYMMISSGRRRRGRNRDRSNKSADSSGGEKKKRERGRGKTESRFWIKQRQWLPG